MQAPKNPWELLSIWETQLCWLKLFSGVGGGKGRTVSQQVPRERLVLSWCRLIAGAFYTNSNLWSAWFSTVFGSAPAQLLFISLRRMLQCILPHTELKGCYFDFSWWLPKHFGLSSGHLGKLDLCQCKVSSMYGPSCSFSPYSPGKAMPQITRTRTFVREMQIKQTARWKCNLGFCGVRLGKASKTAEWSHPILRQKQGILNGPEDCESFWLIKWLWQQNLWCPQCSGPETLGLWSSCLGAQSYVTLCSLGNPGLVLISQPSFPHNSVVKITFLYATLSSLEEGQDTIQIHFE